MNNIPISIMESYVIQVDLLPASLILLITVVFGSLLYILNEQLSIVNHYSKCKLYKGIIIDISSEAREWYSCFNQQKEKKFQKSPETIDLIKRIGVNIFKVLNWLSIRIPMYPALACFINFKFLSEKFIYMYELNQSKITNILREISKNLNNSKREEKFETESNCS